MSGPVFSGEISIQAIRDWAFQAQRDDSLPLEIAGKFTNSSRFLNQLSNGLAAEEKRNSVPWGSFNRWLELIHRIEKVG